MFKRVWEYMNGPSWKPMSYYIGENASTVAYVAFVVITCLYAMAFAIWMILLFVTSPIWVIPYALLYKKR